MSLLAAYQASAQKAVLKASGIESKRSKQSILLKAELRLICVMSVRRVTVHKALTSYSRTPFLKHFRVLHGGNPRVKCRIRV